MIQIFSHRDSTNQRWVSNYETSGFWPTLLTNTWSTDQFINRLNLYTKQSGTRFEFLPYTPESENGYYLIFYGSSRQVTEHHGMAFLTPDIVERVNAGKLKILIVFVYETFDAGISMREWFWNFGNIMTRVGIKRERSIVFLTSTQVAHKLHEDNRCEFLYYPWFEFDIQASFKSHQIAIPTVNFDIKDKLFINLNLTTRQHRFLMVMYLYYKKLINHGYVSWRNPATRSNWNEILTDNGFEAWGLGFRGQLSSPVGAPFYYFITTFKKLPEMRLDDVDLTKEATFNKSWVGASEYYEKAWVDLVSETHCELYGDVFLTEKTFKPMAFGLPFIYNASQWHLKEVKKLGYQSFPELFNESYDAMPSSLEKIIKIGDEISLLCIDPNKQTVLKSPAVKEKILYNQDLFWKKDHCHALAQLLRQPWQDGCT